MFANFITTFDLKNSLKIPDLNLDTTINACETEEDYANAATSILFKYWLKTANHFSSFDFDSPKSSIQEWMKYFNEVYDFTLNNNSIKIDFSSDCNRIKTLFQQRLGSDKQLFNELTVGKIISRALLWVETTDNQSNPASQTGTSHLLALSLCSLISMMWPSFMNDLKTTDKLAAMKKNVNTIFEKSLTEIETTLNEAVKNKDKNAKGWKINQIILMDYLFKLLPFLLSNDPNTYYDYSNIEATLYDQQIKKIYQNLYKLNSLPNTIEYTYFKNIPIIMGLNKFKKILEIAYTAAIAAKNNDDAFAFISTTSPAGGAGSGINAAALPTKNNASITAFFSTPDLFSNTNADDAPLKSNTLTK